MIRNSHHVLLHAAERENAFARIDMEEFKYRDMTLEIYKELIKEEEFRHESHRLGIVFQVYLADSDKIADDLIALAEERAAKGWGPVCIRLVKGAYWDKEVKEACVNPQVLRMPTSFSLSGKAFTLSGK